MQKFYFCRIFTKFLFIKCRIHPDGGKPDLNVHCKTYIFFSRQIQTISVGKRKRLLFKTCFYLLKFNIPSLNLSSCFVRRHAISDPHRSRKFDFLGSHNGMFQMKYVKYAFTYHHKEIKCVTNYIYKQGLRPSQEPHPPDPFDRID